MKETKPENQPMSVEEAVASIGLIIQECSVMGANDYELPELMRLQAAVKNQEIDPDQAISRAEAIRAAKQDYH